MIPEVLHIKEHTYITQQRKANDSCFSLSLSVAKPILTPLSERNHLLWTLRAEGGAILRQMK